MTQVRKVKKDRMFLLFISILLAVSLAFVGTFAAFTNSATATGTITFDANVNVTVRTSSTSAGSSTSQSLTYTLNPVYEEAGTGNFYGGLTGTYGVCKFGSSNSTTPNIYYDIGGEGEAYIGFQMEIKFTPNKSGDFTYANFGAGGSIVDLTKVNNWNIYPSFNGFTPAEVQYGASGVDGTDYSFYKSALKAGAQYGVLCSAPTVSSNGSSYYTKTYTMFITADNGGYTDITKLTLSSSPLSFALSDIINGFNYAININGEEQDLLIGGSITVSITCKAGIFSFTDFS